MCGTCRYCLGFFQLAGILSGLLLIVLISLRYLYGGMPPVLAMAFGFWIHYVAGWLSIYLSIYVVRVVGKGLFTQWTPKYCFCLMIIIIILYTASSICFFVPVTRDRMIEYSHYHYKNSPANKPPYFLDAFQAQYECCGIENYLDYNKPSRMGPEKQLVTNLTTVMDETDDLWYLGKYVYTQYGIVFLEFHKRRKLYYFSVPRSCCKYANRVVDPKCGQQIEFGHSKMLNEKSAREKLNTDDLHGGCYYKYQSIMSQANHFQLNWLIGFLQWGSMIQSFMFFTLIWVFRLALKGMRRDFETGRKLSKESIGSEHAVELIEYQQAVAAQNQRSSSPPEISSQTGSQINQSVPKRNPSQFTILGVHSGPLEPVQATSATKLPNGKNATAAVSVPSPDPKPAKTVKKGLQLKSWFSRK